MVQFCKISAIRSRSGVQDEIRYSSPGNGILCPKVNNSNSQYIYVGNATYIV